MLIYAYLKLWSCNFKISMKLNYRYFFLANGKQRLHKSYKFTGAEEFSVFHFHISIKYPYFCLQDY
ncbi:MAG: hypothetical protein K0R65_2404 [Crocinitomicaceae bacterium]|jgi:hypothetical protein|nr:hypothetical protein [Crocinitomicaceae bacterium]